VQDVITKEIADFYVPVTFKLADLRKSI
jgi:hypothetical protein